MHTDWSTPFERGGGNRSSTWHDCIAFYERLAAAFPHCLRFAPIGHADGGAPIHAGILSAAGLFEPDAARAVGCSVVLLNNGIHPGEPEGIDACMALLRDLCTRAAALQALGDTVVVFIPVYNVDGALNRHDRSRVNQVGPEAFGFRGSARHLDLNRDFIKAQSRNARAFSALFARWDPDVFVDTHTSNGADYQDVVTLIATQPDKLGGALGEFLRAQMLPALYAHMQGCGWPMCPYVDPVAHTPDEGIADFIDTPRFSTGYAALHHCIGFMPETHMLKPFADRYHGMRALLDAVLAFTAREGTRLHALRAADRARYAAAAACAAPMPLQWAIDDSRHTLLPFRGYEAEHLPSRIGRYTRLRYDRSRPYTRPIRYFDRCRVVASAPVPRAYLVPQAWPEVIERLALNGVAIEVLAADRQFDAECWRVLAWDKRVQPFEGHHLHGALALQAEALRLQARAGDCLVPLGRPTDRYVFETLEPLGMDSLFRWGFFDAVLDRKETYSDYVFEDEAERLLDEEPGLRARFDAWCAEDARRLHDQRAVLDFVFAHCRRYAEPEHRRYPVARILGAAPTDVSA